MYVKREIRMYGVRHVRIVLYSTNTGYHDTPDLWAYRVLLLYVFRIYNTVLQNYYYYTVLIHES